MDDQDALDSQRYERMEDVLDNFRLARHDADRIPNFLSDATEVLNAIQKGMSLTSDTAANNEESDRPEPEIARSMDIIMKELIDIEHSFNSHKTLLLQLQNDIARDIDVGDGISKYQNDLEQEDQKYAGLTDNEKYYKHVKYLELKQLQWNARNPDTPMPKSFVDNSAADEDDDDEVIVASSKKSVICPISQKILETPMTSKICHHTFSKSSILGMISRTHGGRVECPVPGCRNVLKISDFYEDTLMERMATKARSARNHGGSSSQSSQFHDVE